MKKVNYIMMVLLVCCFALSGCFALPFGNLNSGDYEQNDNYDDDEEDIDDEDDEDAIAVEADAVETTPYIEQHIELSDEVAVLYDLPMIGFIDWTDYGYEFKSITETEGGYMVLCDILEYAEITYNDYQQLLGGAALLKPYGIVTLDTEFPENGNGNWIGLYLDDYWCEVYIPSPEEDSLLFDQGPITYAVETKEMYIAADAVVYTISGQWGTDGETYDTKTFAQFIEEGSDYGGYPSVMYAILYENEVVEMVEMYAP